MQKKEARRRAGGRRQDMQEKELLVTGGCSPELFCLDCALLGVTWGKPGTRGTTARSWGQGTTIHYCTIVGAAGHPLYC